MSTDLERFGRVIRSARLLRGMTCIDLASRAHVHANTVERVERGTANATTATIGRIVGALELDAVRVEDVAGLLTDDRHEDVSRVAAALQSYRVVVDTSSRADESFATLARVWGQLDEDARFAVLEHALRLRNATKGAA